VHGDEIAKYVAERQRHASRQSLGHHDAPLLAWRGVRIDARLSKHVPVAPGLKPPSGAALRRPARSSRRLPPREPRVHCCWWWGGRGGAILRGDTAHDSADRMRRSCAHNIPLGTLKKGGTFSDVGWRICSTSAVGLLSAQRLRAANLASRPKGRQGPMIRQRHASARKTKYRRRRASAPRRRAVNAGAPLVGPGADRLWAPGCRSRRGHS
jgi:hypothetical protein